MKQKPLVSIITVTFNSEKTISDTLNSILSQSYPNIHHIIVDGLSTDSTIKIIKKYSKLYKKKKIPLSIISEKDNGIYDAINKGILLSNESIIGTLNSDDIYYSKNSISLIVKVFQKFKPDLVYGNLNIYDYNFKYIKRKIISKPFKSGLFEKSWIPPHPTFFTHRNNYIKYGLYKTDYKIAGDGELMFRFLEINKLKPYFLNEHVVKMRIGGVSTNSIKSTILITKETIKSFKENGYKLNLLKYLFYKFIKVKELINTKK